MTRQNPYERTLADTRKRVDGRVQAWIGSRSSLLQTLRCPEGRLFVHYLRSKLRALVVIAALGVVSTSLEAVRLLILLVTLRLIVGEASDADVSTSALGLDFNLPLLSGLDGTGGLFIAFGALGAATVLKEGADLGLTYLSARAQSDFMYEVRRDIMDKLLTLESQYFTDTRSGDIAYLQNTVVGRFSTMLPTAQLYMQAMLDLAVAIVILALISVAMTGILVVLGLGLFGLSGLLRARARRLSAETNEANRETATHFLEAVQGIRLVKLGGQSRRVRERYLELGRRTVDTLVSQLSYGGVIGAVTRVGSIVVVLILAVSLNILSDFGPGANAGLALGFLVIAYRAVTSVGQLVDARLKLTSMIPYFLVIAEFILDERYVEPSSRKSMPEITRVERDIAAEGVSFSYVPERTVLEDVDVELSKGTITALVGPSGSGKTTLLELLAGFRTPDAGRILIDGKDLHQHDIESYRGHLGYVTQETVMFHDTLRANVTFLRPDANAEEIDRALELAEARQFVAEHGLEAVGGERGAKISGGQRQRIALARTLLQDPPVLLLDEATNALDLETEARVFDNLLTAREDKVVVVAAHRLSALTRFDQIIVLHQGRIMEQGTHAELLAARGFYFHLFGLQEFAPETQLDALAQLADPTG